MSPVIERRSDGSGDEAIVCVACPLCAEELPDSLTLADHITAYCRERRRYAEPGALRNGGPDPVATDGGEER